MYAVLHPAFPVRGGIEHSWLDIVHGVGEFCLRGFAGFKFIPKLLKFPSLVRRENGKNPFGTGRFTLGLVFLGRLVIGIGISRVNFHQIMDQEHGDSL